MYIKCWQCGEELDVAPYEHILYQEIIDKLRSMMCDNTIDDRCDLWWRHEDCMAIGNLIADLKEKL